MILPSIRTLGLLFVFSFVVFATAAYSQSSAPPPVEAAIRSLQRGDERALRLILPPDLYRVVSAQQNTARYAALRALGAVEKVTARKVDTDRNGATTYHVNAVHEKGTSHWTVRVAPDGRSILAADFTTAAAPAVAAGPIAPLPPPSRAAPSGGNVGIPPPAGGGPPPMAGGGQRPMLPMPPMAGGGPPPMPPMPPMPTNPSTSAAPPPVPHRAHVRSQSAARSPAALERMDPSPGPAAAPPVNPSATPGGSTPAAPMSRSATPVFPPGNVAGSGVPPSTPRPEVAPAPRSAPAAPTSTPAAPEQSKVSARDRVVDFLFATSRAQDTSLETVAFSGQRARALTYGQASIRIPEDHRLGEITVPSVWKAFGITLSKEELDEHEHFTIRALKTLTLDQWDEAIRIRNPKSALIFVHGYNTSFEDALYRNAQIIWDLRYEGLSVLYSWASMGSTFEYLYDRESAQIGRAGFIQVLRNLKEKHGIETVNVIAHSMGNQVVLDALGIYAQTNNPVQIGELILAAPDVDRDLFTSLIPDVQKIVKGITLYASSADKALQASRRLAGVVRAGDIGSDGPIILDHMQTIDVTAMGEEMLGLNHNVFAVSRNLIDDIRLLITRGLRPPDQRMSQIRPCPEITPRYWCFFH
jgi:esterase/lipase superfamily enzyme